MEIYKELVKLVEDGRRGAVATVIGSKGSTPGKESAKMLIREDGSTVGTIGGGCTEAEVWALAREVMEKDQPLRKEFILTPKHAEDEGLACGGVVEIFIEPVGSPIVYLFGAGHIARSLVPLMAGVGFNTVVIDDRAQFADRQHFPQATDVRVMEFPQAFREIRFGSTAYIVIVTRGHKYDQLVLSEAIRTAATYIGLIGSRAKISRIFRTLKKAGASAERLAQVKAPIGLDIGCRTPEEIAISIAAQLIAHRRKAFIKGVDPERLPQTEPMLGEETAEEVAGSGVGPE